MLAIRGTSRWVRSDDGLDLHERWWMADDPRAVLVFVHGIASHGGWFSETAEHLVAENITTVAPDRRGSGRSGGVRGHLPSFERAMADLDHLIQRVRTEHRDLPVVVGASSWAAKLALVRAGRRQDDLAGLALLGPGLFPTVDLPLPRRLQVAIAHAARPRASIPIPLTPELYTSEPGYLAFVREDPLRLLTATAQLYWETLRLDRRRAAASARLRLPLLVLQGEDDAMMSVPRTRQWFEQLAWSDATYRSYPGAGHTLDFHADRGAYLSDLGSWLCRR